MAFILEALRGAEPCGSPALTDCATKVRDWRAVAAMSGENGVSPWLARAVSRSGIVDIVAPGAFAAMRDQARASALTSLTLAQALEGVLLVLEDAGVPVAVLKGPVIAERYYPDAGLRPYRDLDLLVPLDCHERVAALCARLGYAVVDDHGGVCGATTAGHRSPFETLFRQSESNVLLDVHYDHLQIGLVPRDIGGLWQRCEPWSFQRASAKRPALNDLFLLLAVHLHRHGFGRLIWFKDLDLIVRREGSRLDWQWLASAARAEGVANSLGSVLRLLERLLGTPLPDDAMALTKGTTVGLLHRLLWPDDQILDLRPRPGRWRRAVQFVPRDGVRGGLPSLLVMGRRTDKLRSLLRRPR
ncbi:MAG: nucleotidyltransferase domain-containing protein [Dehalococcoidia bacterium]